jgi:CRISPR system Cascade subunit CasA
MENKFNLIDEAWIPCLMLETNETKDLSLFEALSEAHKIKEIVHNSPLVVVSLHRLLLAILHRNFGPKSFDEWKQFWQKGSWDTEKLGDYFEKNKDRFNLFDEERPFYQYPEITKKGGKEADILPIEALMQESATGNNATLFDHSFEAEPKSCSYAEAARYLITRHSFSFAGGVSFPFNFSNGMLVSGFSVLATGRNLFETLALNLVIYHRDKPIPIQDDDEDITDVPFWEREELVQATEKDKDGTIPLGYLDYLTWQSRRIKLIKDEETEQVKYCQLQQNFKLKEPTPIFDPFKVYVKGESGFYPLNLREDKSFWRSSHTILQQATSIDNRSSLFSHLKKVQSMIANGEIEGLKNHAFSIFGVINDKANVKSWTHEKLPIPLVYMNDNELLNDLETAINFAEEMSGVLKFAMKILADELESDANSFPAMSLYWASLENRLSCSAKEQKAIVEAESAFYKTRAKLLNRTSEFRQYLPKYKSKGGNE